MRYRLLLPLFGLLLFGFILLNIDIAETARILSGADVPLVALAALTALVSVAMKSLKWKLIIGLYDRDYSLAAAMRAWLMGFSLSMATPARLGDLSRAYYLKARMGLGKGLVTVVADRVVDMSVLFFLALMGFLSLVSMLPQQQGLIVAVSALFALFLAAVYLSTRKRLAALLLRPFMRVVPEKHRSEVGSTFHEFYTNLGRMRSGKRTMGLAVLLGALAWLATVLEYYFLALSLNLGISYVFLLSVMPIVVLLDMLPVSFSGIGTRDAALIFFFSLVPLGKEYAVSFSILVFVFSYAFLGLIGAGLMLKLKGRN
jgi:hypothetical protein